MRLLPAHVPTLFGGNNYIETNGQLQLPLCASCVWMLIWRSAGARFVRDGKVRTAIKPLDICRRYINAITIYKEPINLIFI